MNTSRHISFARILTLVGCMILLFSGRVSALSTLQQADSAYNAQNFRYALSLYNKVLDNEGASSALYYNIGNTYYRLGDTGKSIVAYERALRFDPSNDDARANLAFVNASQKGLPEDGSSFISNLHDNVVSLASPDGWSIVAFALFLLLLGCVAFYLFATHPTVRKAGFFGGIIVLALFVYAFVIAWQTAGAPDRTDVAIVIRQNSRLTSNPGTTKNKDEKTVSIPEGSKVFIIDSLATPNDPVTAMWYNVSLNNNTEAWIDAADVEKI